MKRLSYHISRIGLGITFVWIGVLIFGNPAGWGAYVQPWALNLLPVPIVQIMMFTAILDVTIGVLLLFNLFVWVVSFVAALHIASVLIVSGITDVTVRDIAILYCAIALFVDTLPQFITRRFSFLR